MLVVAACGPLVTVDRMQALEAEFAALGKPENAAETQHFVNNKTNRAVVSSSYRAARDEGVLRAYYDPAFARNGWLIGEHVTKTGLSVTCYSKGELSGAFEYATDVTLGWTYSLELTIGQPCR